LSRIVEALLARLRRVRANGARVTHVTPSCNRRSGGSALVGETLEAGAMLMAVPAEQGRSRFEARKTRARG
jgi:hypothetical protein